MSSRDPPPPVLGSKVRRADTGGQTHANERGFAKTFCATGAQVRLAPRNATPRTGGATKANGPSSSTPDSSVVAMDVGKENAAPPDGRVLKVRGGERRCCLRESSLFPRATTSARVSRVDAPRALRRAGATSTARLVALPRASGRRCALAAA